MTEPTHELEAYFAGDSTDAQLRTIEAWIHAAPANARAFVEQIHFREVVAQHIREQANRSGLALAELARLEEAAESMVVTIHDGKDWNSPGLSNKQWYGAVSYIVEHCITPRVIGGIAAAVLLLGVVLAIALLTGPDDPLPIANTPQHPGPMGEPINPPAVVATLTAERDAVWDRRPGEDLYAGQRFVLIEGLAEITTKRGAVAILQAPATVELLNSPNAIRLHSGKLVGICETEASKGFVVRTPFMDITDLGTRFGIDTDDRKTEVHVFEGAVTAIRPDASVGSVSTPVIAGESAITSIETDAILHKQLDAEAFAGLQPAPIQLPGTGWGLTAGQPDPNWFVMSADGVPFQQPIQMTAAAHNAYGMSRDQSGKTPGSWWLQSFPEQRPTPQQPRVVHLIQSGLELDANLDPRSARLVIACAVDDLLKAIHVNGNRITDLGVLIGRVHHLTIDQYLKAGRNTIAFEVENKWNDPKPNPIGLYVRWHLLPEAGNN